MSNLLYHELGNKPVTAKGEFAFSDYPLTQGEFIHRLRQVASTESGIAQKVNEPDLWTGITAGHTDFIDLLNQNEPAAEAHLNHMFSSPLTHGLEQGDAQYRQLVTDTNARYLMIWQVMDKLVSLAEAFGCVPVENPEQGERGKLIHTDPDELLEKIEQELETKIRPPPFKGDLFCLKTDHGLFTSRDLLAIYEANRIAELCPDRRTAICEIGGGTGYLAYYCQQLGFKNYTIIDLPTVNIVQAYFLHKNLPDTRLILSDDRTPFDRDEALKVLSSRFFKAAPKGAFDIVINVDSFPEIADKFAVDYIRDMRDRTKLFLSINQEAMAPRNSQGDLQARVGDQVTIAGGWRRLSRYPFWMRRGYVEEIYVPDNSNLTNLIQVDLNSSPARVQMRSTQAAMSSTYWKLTAPFRHAASVLEKALDRLRDFLISER